MHLEIVINHNSNTLRVEKRDGRKLVKKSEIVTCDRPHNVIRILHLIFDELTNEGLAFTENDSISITEINEDSVRNAGEW